MNKKSLFLTSITILTLCSIYTGVSYFGLKTTNTNQKQITSNKPGLAPAQGQVLSEHDELGNVTFNVPAIFNHDITAIDHNLNLANGQITASNVIYSIQGQNGITVTGGQNAVVSFTGLTGILAGDGIELTTGSTPTLTNAGVRSFQGKTGAVTLEEGTGIDIDGTKITNSDLGSSQNIFKIIAVSGQNNVTADANSDTLTFVAGSNITLTTSDSGDSLTIAAAAADASGWTDDGTDVRLTTSTDNVGIGTATPSSKLHVIGTTTISSTLTLGGSMVLGSDTVSDLTGAGLTLSGGAVTVNLTTSGSTGSTSSNSGLEVSSSGVTLLKGCSTGEVLKWNESNSLWECSTDIGGGSSGIVIVQEGDVDVSTTAGTLDFTAADFIASESPSGEVNISIDYVNSSITRTNQNETISGNWTFSGTLSVNNNLTIGDTSADTLTVTAVIAGASPLVFEGATADANETTIAVTDPDADRTITIPNSSGTIILSGHTFTDDVTATLDSDGSTSLTIAANSVALTTDTTGNYVATITAGDGLTGDASSEGATPTLAVSTGNGIQISSDAVALGPLSANWSQTGAFDIVLNNASSELSILESSGATFYGTVDVGDLSANRTYTLPDATGEICLSTGNCAGQGTNGDITAVGDITSGAAFDGSQGNILYFEGSTADANEIALTGADASTDRTITLPDLTGTVSLLENAQTFTGLKTFSGGLTVSAGTTTIDGTLTINSGTATIGDAASDMLTITSTILGGSPLVFEGSTADANETTITITDPDADRTITIPNLTGTLALLENAQTFSGQKTFSAGLIVSASGASITGGIDNNSGGVTEAGAISGVTTLSASSTVTFSGLGSGGTTLLCLNGSNQVTTCTASAAGDITAVGDVTTGDAFTATAGNDGTTLYFEGSTADGNEIALTAADPGSDLTVTLPAITGTLASLAGSQTFTGAKTFNATTTFDGAIAANTDIDLTFAASENMTLTNSSASTDQLSLSITGVTTDGVDAFAIAYTQADDADATDTNSAINIALTSSSTDADAFYGLHFADFTGGSATETAIRLGTGFDNILELEGSTADANETRIVLTDPTSDQTITFPNATGTIIVSGHTFTSDVTGTLDSDGSTVLTIAADSVALATDTTGNYVATITNGNGISGSSSTEGGTPTIALGDLTSNWSQSGAFDIVLNNASSELSILESSGATFYGTIDVTDLSANRTYTFPDASGTVCLTSGNCAGVGGVGTITAVGDITSGAAFDGTQGTTLYFEGSTADDNEIALTTADPGSDLTVTLPSITGTLASLAGSQTFSGAKTFNATTTFDGSIAANTDIDLTFTASENMTLTNSSASTDQLTLSVTGVTTDGVDAFAIAYTQADDADATDTNSAVNIALTSSSDNADVFYGIQFADFTGGAASETALRFGTGFDNILEIEGSSADANETRVAFTNPTADQIITFPDDTGTVCLSSGNCAGGAGGSKWTDGGTVVYLTTTTDSVTIGGTSELAKLAVDGDADEIQLLIQGHSTQTSNLLVLETSAGSDQLTVTNGGALAIEGALSDISGTVLEINDDLKVTGNDIIDSGDTTRISLGTTTTLTNTTTTLSGTTTLTASSLATFSTAATLDMTSTTTLNCADCLNFDDFADSLSLDASTSVALAASSFTLNASGAGNIIHNLSSTGDFIIQDNGTAYVTFADDSTTTWTLPAAGYMQIDASTTATTTTAGVIDLNVNAGDAAVIGQDVTLTQNDGATASRDAIGLRIGLTANDADGDVFGLQINSAATTNAAAGSYEALIRLSNAENTAGVVPDAILVTTTSGTSGDIIDALDASASDITNAINAGENFLVLSTTRIFESGGTFTIEDTDGNDLLTIIDGGTTGSATVTGTLTIASTASVQGNTFGLNNDADSDNIFSYNSASAGSAGGDLYWGDDLLCDVSEANCGWATAAASPWQTTSGVVNLVTSGDTVTVGSSTALAKLAVDGDADEVQFLVQGNGTQTSNLIVFENSSGTDLFTVTNGGVVTASGNINANGGLDIDDVFVIADGGAVTANTDVDIVLASGENFTVTHTTPTVDAIAASLGTSSTDGVDALQLTYGVSAASGNVIDITPSYADATAGSTSETYYIIDIDSFTATQNASTDTGDIRGVNIGKLTQTETAGTITASAFRVGTGWDDVLNYNGTTVINGSGQVVSTQINGTIFSTDSDTASANAIARGDTLTINGDSNGIDVTHSGDTMTVAFDGTEVGAETWGSGSGFAWTFDVGATDPTLTFASNAITIGSAATLTATDVTTFNCTDCLNFDDLSDSLALDASTSIAFDASEVLTIDASSTDTTTTGGVIDFNIDAGNAAVIGLNVDFAQSDGATAATDAVAQRLTLSANDADGDMFGLQIVGAATTNATAGSYEAAISIDNAEDTAASMTDAIVIKSSGANNGITDAIDVSAANINNAINAGANFITFDGIRIFEGTTGTYTVEDTAGNDLLRIVDNSNVGDVTATGVLSVLGSTIGLDNDSDVDNLIGLSAAAGQAGANLYWGNRLLCDATAANCGWATVGANSPWTTTSNVVNLNTSTDNVTVGSSTNLAKLAVDGDTDEVQLLVQGNGTQTSNLVVFENSSGTDQFTITNSGVVTAIGNINADGGLDIDDVFVVADGGVVTANTDVNLAFAGSENLALSYASAPTASMFTLSNFGQATTTTGVAGISLDFYQGADAAADGNVGLSVFATTTADNAGDALDAIEIYVTNTSSAGIQNGLDITFANTSQNAVSEAGIKIDNEETTASTLTDAIIVTSSGVNGGVVDAFDASAANITNALNAGANFIIMDGIRMFEGSTGTLTFEDTSGNDLMTITDNGSNGNVTITNNLSVTGTITANTDETINGLDISSGAISDATSLAISSAASTAIALTRSSAGQWLSFNDGTDSWGIYNTAGSPEGSLTANTGALSMDTTNGTLYVKTDDGDNTGWVNLATGGTSPWQTTSNVANLVTATDNVTIGSSTSLAKLAVDGDSDEIQFLVQGHSTQTSSLMVLENSSGTDQFTVSNTGNVVAAGTVTATGTTAQFILNETDNVPWQNTVGGDQYLIQRNGSDVYVINLSDTITKSGHFHNNEDATFTFGASAGSSTLVLEAGGSSEIALTTTNFSPNAAEGNSLGSSSLEWEQLFLGDDNGISFGLDQDWSMVYDEATDDRLELTTSGTSGMLISSATVTGTGLAQTFNSITTGTGNSITTNALTTGTALSISSTSTALTTGRLASLDWSPTSATTATGDLFRINIGSNGNVANLFNITDNGSTLFSVSETSITSAVPHSFTAAGDVSIAYDIVMTNQTASYLKSSGPLYIETGEAFESNDLTLKTFNSGGIILDGAGNTAVKGGDLVISSDGTLTSTNIGGTGLLAYGAICADDTLDTADDCIDAARDAGTVYGISSSFAIDDVGENFPTEDESISAGDIVALDYKAPLDTPVASESGQAYETEFVKKATIVDGQKVMGIISEKPGVLLGGWGQKLDPRSVQEVAVGLVGRIPVKVTTQNGPIEPGDYITLSDIPGVGAKAIGTGYVIGKALDKYNNPNTGEVGTVLVFIHNMYYNPVNTPATLAATSPESLSSTAMPHLLVSGKSELSDVVVTGEFVAGNLSITGLSQDGGADLTTLSGSLKLQADGTNPVEIMAGKVIIDTDGNIIAEEGTLTAKTVAAKKINVDDEDVLGASIGEGILSAGLSSVVINTTAVTDKSQIFVTAKTLIDKPLAVTTKQTGESFTVEISESSDEDITFSWWIVN